MAIVRVESWCCSMPLCGHSWVAFRSTMTNCPHRVRLSGVSRDGDEQPPVDVNASERDEPSDGLISDSLNSCSGLPLSSQRQCQLIFQRLRKLMYVLRKASLLDALKLL